MKEGKTENKTSPPKIEYCGKDYFFSLPPVAGKTYIYYVYILFPPHGVTGVGEGRALRLPGPVSLPLPR